MDEQLFSLSEAIELRLLNIKFKNFKIQACVLEIKAKHNE